MIVNSDHHNPSVLQPLCISAPLSMPEICDLKVDINGQHTFVLDRRILCSYSGRLKKLVKQERKRGPAKVSWLKVLEFPGGPYGFELVSRFCYNNGSIDVTPSNVCFLHCGAIFLEMTEQVSAGNLLAQTEAFLDGVLHWAWNDILTAMKSFELFLPAAESCGLFHRFISCLLGKISANSELIPSSVTTWPSSSSSSSSPETSSGSRCTSTSKTPEPIRPCFRTEWWFEDLTTLAPNMIEEITKTIGAYGMDNKSPLWTRFLLHYLKSTVQSQRPSFPRTAQSIGRHSECYGGLADTAVHGVVLIGKGAFSCRGLFWILRVVSGFGLSRECRHKLERLMGSVLDQATLDDILVPGHDEGVYDVNLVLRLVRIFAHAEDDDVSLQRMKKVGRLMDKYLGEISPDHGLKVSKFLAVAESLPDSARDCFNGVYRALDIYLQSHPKLPIEERTRLCRCLNYEKLTLEACKHLAKNRLIPPRVAVHALAAQKSNLRISTGTRDRPRPAQAPIPIFYGTTPVNACTSSPESSDEKEELKLSLHRMQGRVMELEKVCRVMKGQMSMMIKGKPSSSFRGLPRLC